MAGKRIIINGVPVDFTTENSKFRTDITSPINPKYPGSVTPHPLDDDGSNILVLERVVNIKTGGKCLWFMWYKNGIPSLPESAVFNEEDIVEVIRHISKIIF